MKKIVNFHKTEEIRKFLGDNYTEEAVNKVQNFYFNERNVENEITKLENICHVSKRNCTLYLTSTFKYTYLNKLNFKIPIKTILCLYFLFFFTLVIHR